MKMKKGDTLIEVSLAIGIFALVAITIAALVSSSMSGAQLSLETTITREQIDAQAEALRYIHASYIAGGQANNAGENRYVKLWREITGFSKNPPIEALDFVPATCEELYNNEYPTLADQNAFVINLNGLYELNPANRSDAIFEGNEWMGNVLVTAKNAGFGADGIFQTAETFPRIFYRGEDEDVLMGQGVGTRIGRAEGLYVVPVRDESSTMMVESGGIMRKAAYYDFYIRSCWFGAGADRPSTIATVIRLYDPDVITY